MATHAHTWGHGLVDPNSIVYALLDVNVCKVNEMEEIAVSPQTTSQLGSGAVYQAPVTVSLVS